MSSPTSHDFEIISVGPGVGWWSSPEQRQKAFRQTVARYVDEWRYRASVDALLANEVNRHQSRKRQSKPISVPNGTGLLTIDQVAARLGRHRRTVERYIEDGVLKAARIGGRGHLRIRESDVEAMLVVERSGVSKNRELHSFIENQVNPR